MRKRRSYQFRFERSQGDLYLEAEWGLTGPESAMACDNFARQEHV